MENLSRWGAFFERVFQLIKDLGGLTYNGRCGIVIICFYDRLDRLLCLLSVLAADRLLVHAPCVTRFIFGIGGVFGD